MKYSKEMLAAHEKSIKAYEQMINFAKDKSNDIAAVQKRAKRFSYNSMLNCNYCIASIVGDDRGVEADAANCNKCIIGMADRWNGCVNSGMYRSYSQKRDAYCADRTAIITAFTNRLDALVLQAAFNISEK